MTGERPDRGPSGQQFMHLALAAEWDEAVGRGGPYLRSTIGRSLDEVGFIHCSFADQVDATRERFYAGRDDVVLLTVDPARVDAPIRVEDLAGTDEVFPHVYGPLELDAVIDVQPIGAAPDTRADGGST